MGSPKYPTPLQWAALRKAAETPAPDSVALKEGTLEIALPPYGLALVELK
jgi:xylan 1,4-beta-xylosidase